MNKTIEAFDKVRESATRLGESADRLVAHIDSMKAQHTPSQPVKQEPVAWVDAKEEGYEFHGLRELPAGKHHLYAAPVRTKDLTDDEAQKLWNDTSSIVPMWAHHLHFARAVIAAYREKNNANNNT